MEALEKPKQRLTIVCPVYNEELAIPLFYKRLKQVLSSLKDLDYDIIFTNNRSTDNSFNEIRKLQAADPKVNCLTFSRNFGYQASILAGLAHATGDISIIIDVDCEDPPELIPQFIQKWREGHDICYGIRCKRDEARWITSLRLLFYRILKFTADTDIILDMAEFALLAKHVREIIVQNSNTFPFLRADIAYSGFRKIGIAYDRQKRIVGTSYYNLRGMAAFAIAGIMSVSTFPLRAAAYLFPFVALINVFGLLLDYVWHYPLFNGLVIFDIIYLIALTSSQGLYTARIYKNGIGRPVYIVDWELSDVKLQLRPRVY